MENNTKVIAVSSEKGGVGKTTTACTLAHGLAIQGHKTLLIDLDPQGQVATSLDVEQEPCVFNWLASDLLLSDVIRSSKRNNLSLIPGNKRTAVAQLVLNAENQTLAAIRSRLASIRLAEYAAVVIDTAPSVGGLQEAGLYAADLVVIPTATDYLSSEGVVKTFGTLDVLRERHGWRGRVLGILPTFFDETTRESKATLDDLKATYGEDVVLDPIHRATVLRECASEGKTIWEVAPKSRAAEEYACLVWRIYGKA